MSLYLGSSVLVPLVRSDPYQRLANFLFSTPMSVRWQVFYGLWVFFYIRSTLNGLHFSLGRQLFLAFFMSLVGDQCFYLLMPGHPPDFERYWSSLFIQFLCSVFALTIVHFLPESIARRLLRLATIPAFVLGAAVQSRLFSFLPYYFQGADQSLLLISSLLLLQWNQLVDSAERYFTGQRAVSVYGTRHVVIRVVLAAASVFAMSRRSAVSPILGVYPFEAVVGLVFVAQVYLYARANLTSEPSLNKLQRESCSLI
jgi:hypothetical protein